MGEPQFAQVCQGWGVACSWAEENKLKTQDNRKCNGSSTEMMVEESSTTEEKIERDHSGLEFLVLKPFAVQGQDHP